MLSMFLACFKADPFSSGAATMSGRHVHISGCLIKLDHVFETMAQEHKYNNSEPLTLHVVFGQVLTSIA